MALLNWHMGCVQSLDCSLTTPGSGGTFQSFQGPWRPRDRASGGCLLRVRKSVKPALVPRCGLYRRWRWDGLERTASPFLHAVTHAICVWCEVIFEAGERRVGKQRWRACRCGSVKNSASMLIFLFLFCCFFSRGLHSPFCSEHE